MYFPHAFQKAFLPLPVSGAVTLASSGTTASLTAGEIGVYNPKTWAALTSASAAPFVLAQGSYYTSDKIGPFHGGYKESVKSKTINPAYISRIMKVVAKTALNQIRTIELCNTTCEQTYRLRMDIKGSPALRFLGRNIYDTLDGFAGCCVDKDNPTIVDPTIVVIQWARQIQESPILSQFITVVVKDTTGATVTDFDTFVPEPAPAADDKAQLVITVAYLDTKFAVCTFTPTDHYELEPLFVYTSMVDETGNPCNVHCFTDTETQAPRQLQGSGESVKRELILDARYRQEHFPDSSAVDHLRMREIEANPSLAALNVSGLWDKIMILHHVPRFSNPSGTFDDDQYLITLWVPTGTTTTAVTSYLTGSTTAAGNTTVTLETF